MQLKKFNVELTFVKNDQGEISIIPGMILEVTQQNKDQIFEIFGMPKTVKIACNKYATGYPFKGSYIALK